MAKETRLTPKQEKFAQHLATHGNKTAAYKHAYKWENMSPKTNFFMAISDDAQQSIRNCVSGAST